MTTVSEHPKILTLDEYLEWESFAPAKHHYENGNIIPTAGGTTNHNLIAANLVTAINNAVRKTGKKVLVYGSDMKIWVPSANRIRYPDAVAVCEKPEYNNERKDMITNPVIIAEVVSPSSEDDDRGDKFQKFRSIPTLQEYLIIDRDQALVTVARRSNANTWEFEEISGLDDHIHLNSVSCSVALSDVYFYVEFV